MHMNRAMMRKLPWSSPLMSLGLILEHFLKFLLKCFLRTSEVFSAVLPRMRFLKLKARSLAPGYIHAPPAP